MAEGFGSFNVIAPIGDPVLGDYLLTGSQVSEEYYHITTYYRSSEKGKHIEAMKGVSCPFYPYDCRVRTRLIGAVGTYFIDAVQAIDVQFLILLFAGRRLALRRSASAARRRECRHAAMYTPSGEHPLSDHQLQAISRHVTLFHKLIP